MRSAAKLVQHVPKSVVCKVCEGEEEDDQVNSETDQIRPGTLEEKKNNSD